MTRPAREKTGLKGLKVDSEGLQPWKKEPPTQRPVGTPCETGIAPRVGIAGYHRFRPTHIASLQDAVEMLRSVQG
jgi:hypothetical protein